VTDRAATAAWVNGGPRRCGTKNERRKGQRRGSSFQKQFMCVCVRACVCGMRGGARAAAAAVHVELNQLLNCLKCRSSVSFRIFERIQYKIRATMKNCNRTFAPGQHSKRVYCLHLPMVWSLFNSVVAVCASIEHNRLEHKQDSVLINYRDCPTV
jgi:hypothetical protein